MTRYVAVFLNADSNFPTLCGPPKGCCRLITAICILSRILHFLEFCAFSSKHISSFCIHAWVCSDSHPCGVQAEKPDVIMGIPYFPCTAMLAVKLDVPYISLHPAGLPGSSFASPLWRGSGRDTGIAPHIVTVPKMFVDIVGPPMVSRSTCDGCHM